MRKEKKQFFIRLQPPRPEFSTNMSEEERKLMQEHLVYWQGLLRKKIAIAFGPVLDPRGVYGVGIIEVEDQAIAEAFMARDPTIRSGKGFSFEIFVMRLVKK